MKVGVVIPAAGTGSRMGAGMNKLLVLVNSRPVIDYCIQTFLKNPMIDEVVLVIREDERTAFDQWYKNEVKIRYAIGGKDRKTSVRNGVFALGKTIDYVLIHDGARPFVTPDLIACIIKELNSYEAVIPTLAVKDTIKVVNESMVVKTLVRSELRAVQTPQGFKRTALTDIYESKNFLTLAVTDEASLIEAFDGQVKTVDGLEENFKITTPIDMLLMKGLLEKGTICE